MKVALLVLPALLVACTGSSDGETGAPADSSSGTTPIQDSGEPEPVPVWSSYRVETSSTFNGVYPSGEGVYLVGTAGAVYVGGASGSWTAMPPDLDDVDFTDVWGAGAGDSIRLVASATSGNIARYTAGGWTVEDIGTSNHNGVGGSAIESLFAVSFGGIYAYDGVTWAFEAPPENERLNDVWGLGGEAFAVGEGGAILRRATGGGWTRTDLVGVTANLNGVAGSSLSDVWAVGADGVALHYDGTAWTSVPTGVTSALWAVFAPAPTSVYAVGNNGVALFWNGTEWTALPTGVDNNLYAVAGASATNVWAVGNRGAAIQYKAE